MDLARRIIEKLELTPARGFKPKRDDVEKLARAFSEGLKTALPDEDIQEIIAMNIEETDPGVCHSHDFLDANIVMEQAFVDTFGREPDPADDADATMWGDAWDVAKENNFYTD